MNLHKEYEDLRSELPDFVKNPWPEIYRTFLPLFLDFETTNLDNGSALNDRNRLVLSVWRLGWEGELKHSWGSELEQSDLLAAVEKADFIVAHNAKFELQWLDRCGIDLRTVLVYDTMLAEYVIGGNRWKTHQLGLETCLRRHGFDGKESVVSSMIKAGICPSEIPSEWLLSYCRRDVTALSDLMRSQLKVMEGTRLLPVVYTRCLLTPVLADIEKNGMQLDTGLVRTMFEAVSSKHNRLVQEMNTMTGGLAFKSRPKLREYLYDTLGFAEVMEKKGREWKPRRTETGQRATDADTMLELKATTAGQRAFKDLYVRLNESSQLVSKYLTKFNECSTEAGGLLYANSNQTNTQTHRLSSTGRRYSAQFQNFPREFKPLFRARRDGYLIGEADGAQLEFRVAAHLGRCSRALADIEANVDVHTYTAEVLTAAGQPTDRQGAKEHTFKPLYGGQSGTDAERTYYRAFREKYPGVTKTQQEWVGTVLEKKYLETEWGLRYYWPDTRMDRSGYITNTTSICNYPVQAFATAEIIPLALVLMWHVTKTMDITLVNTVHDSIAAEIHPDEVENFKLVSRWALTDEVYALVEDLYGVRLVCRLGCGVKVATHWGATKDETKYEAFEWLYKEAA